MRIFDSAEKELFSSGASLKNLVLKNAYSLSISLLTHSFVFIAVLPSCRTLINIEAVAVEHSGLTTAVTTINSRVAPVVALLLPKEQKELHGLTQRLSNQADFQVIDKERSITPSLISRSYYIVLLIEKLWIVSNLWSEGYKIVDRQIGYDKLAVALSYLL